MVLRQLHLEQMRLLDWKPGGMELGGRKPGSVVMHWKWEKAERQTRVAYKGSQSQVEISPADPKGSRAVFTVMLDEERRTV